MQIVSALTKLRVIRKAIISDKQKLISTEEQLLGLETVGTETVQDLDAEVTNAFDTECEYLGTSSTENTLTKLAGLTRLKRELGSALANNHRVEREAEDDIEKSMSKLRIEGPISSTLIRGTVNNRLNWLSCRALGVSGFR